MIDYVDALIDIANEKFKLLEEYIGRLKDNNKDFFQLKTDYGKIEVQIDSKFLNVYSEFLKLESVDSILELNVEKFSNLEKLKDIITIVDGLEKELSSLENSINQKMRASNNLFKASNAYKIHKK